jgi:WD40 repeat protein
MDLAVKSPRLEILTQSGSRDLFAREAETWANLGLHPHIVCCYYVRALGGIPRIFIEYIDGGSLAGWIRQRKLYGGGPEKALERILDIAVQFAWGLDYAHEQGLIHQDIKPANVMMTLDGTAKVTDFGLAKARMKLEGPIISSDRQSILASSGGITPAYCSPEQAAGEKLSRRTDIWSWGLSILEMFTGEAAWLSGVAAPEALEGYLRARPEGPALPAMPVRLAELLRRCFQVDPHARPAGMAEIAAELREIYREETGRIYWREVPAALNLRADSLNNKAVSLLDLGREKEARQCWEEALKLDPRHLEAAFNFSQFRWYNAELTINTYLAELKRIEAYHGTLQEYWTYLAWACLQTGVAKEIINIKKSGQFQPDCNLLNAFAHFDSGLKKQKIYHGHNHNITAARFSPDSRYIVSGSWDNTVRLWEVESGHETRTFKGHQDAVTDVCFSPDGRQILSAGMDKTVRLWRMDNSTPTVFCSIRKGFFSSARFSPDGRLILLGTTQAAVQLWDIHSGRKLRDYKGSNLCINSVCISPDNRYVLAGSADGFIHLWDLASKKRLKILTGHTGGVNCACFSSDGHCVLSGGSDHTIRLWEIFSGQLLKVFKGHAGPITSVCFSPDNCYALSGSMDFTVRIWDIANGKMLKVFNNHTDSVESVCFSPDGRLAISGSKDNTIKLYDIQHELQKVITGTFFISRITAVVSLKNETDEFQVLFKTAQAFIRDKKVKEAYLALRKAQRIPGYSTNQELLNAIDQIKNISQNIHCRGLYNMFERRIFKGHTDWVNSVCFSPDGRYMLSGSKDAILRLWEVSSGRELKSFRHPEGVSAACFSKKGNYLLSGCWDGIIRLWEIESGKEARVFQGHNGPVYSVDISPDNSIVLSGSEDKTIRLWDIETGGEIKILKGHLDKVSTVCFSPDGQYVISRSDTLYARTFGMERTFRLWEVLSGKEVTGFPRWTSNITAFAFSPDGNTVMIGEISGVIRCCEMPSGRELQRIEEPYSIWSLCFSAGGRYFLSGCGEKGIIILREAVKGEEIKRITAHYDKVSTLAFSPDSRFALSGSWDGTVKLWEFDWDWEFGDEIEKKPKLF